MPKVGDVVAAVANRRKKKKKKRKPFAGAMRIGSALGVAKEQSNRAFSKPSKRKADSRDWEEERAHRVSKSTLLRKTTKSNRNPKVRAHVENERDHESSFDPEFLKLLKRKRKRKRSR